MPLGYRAVDAGRYFAILLRAPHPVAACHIACYEEPEPPGIERRSGVDLVVLVSSAQKPLVIADRQKSR